MNERSSYRIAELYIAPLPAHDQNEHRRTSVDGFDEPTAGWRVRTCFRVHVAEIVDLSPGSRRGDDSNYFLSHKLYELRSRPQKEGFHLSDTGDRRWGHGIERSNTRIQQSRNPQASLQSILITRAGQAVRTYITAACALIIVLDTTNPSRRRAAV